MCRRCRWHGGRRYRASLHRVSVRGEPGRRSSHQHHLGTFFHSAHCTMSVRAGEPGRCTSHQRRLGTFFQSNNCRSSAVHSQASRKKENRGDFSEVSSMLMLIEEISHGRRWPRTESAPYYVLQPQPQQSILDLCARSHCCTVYARRTQAWPLRCCHSRMRATTACSSLLLKT
jgi:hypothetical protein